MKKHFYALHHENNRSHWGFGLSKSRVIYSLGIGQRIALNTRLYFGDFSGNRDLMLFLLLNTVLLFLTY